MQLLNAAKVTAEGGIVANPFDVMKIRDVLSLRVVLLLEDRGYIDKEEGSVCLE
jgi:hypothetical protein